MSVSIKFNVPRKELANEGYRVFRHAPSFQTAKLVTEPSTDGGKGGADSFGWKQSDYEDFWRHPATGALSLKPSGLKADLFENLAYSPGRIEADDWLYTSADWKSVKYQEWEGVPGSFEGFVPLRYSKDSNLTPLSVGGTHATFKTQVDTPLIWTHSLDNLLTQNQGFGLMIQGAGISFQRGSGLAMVGFGDRYVLEITTSGVAKLWCYVSSTWFQAATIDYGAGGIKVSNPLQINVIVTGPYLSILVSDITQSAKASQTKSGRTPRKDVSHTIDVREIYSDIVFNESLGLFTNVIPPARLLFGCRPKTYHVSWSMYKNVYDTDDKECFLMPENLMTKKEQGGLSINTIGVKSTEPYPALLPWYNVQAMAPSGLTTWTTDHSLAPIKVTMRAAIDRSPELWGYGVTIPEVTIVPEWTPIDHSDKFLRLIFKRSLDLDGSTADIRLALDSEPRSILKLLGPVEIKASDIKVWEGYVTQRRPTIEGGQAVLITDQIQCRGIETRLAESPAGFETIGSLTIRETILKLFESAGISNDDVVFEDADEWLDDLIPAPQGQEQDKMWSADTMVGDALRAICETYGVQGRSALQITYNPPTSKWNVKTKSAYDPETPPTKRFWSASVPVGYETENDRWDAGEFKIFEPVELTIIPPEFNALRMIVASSTAEDTKAIGTVVDIDPASVNDDTADDFVGRLKQKVMQSPKNLAITTLAEAERYSRFLIDQFSTRSIFASWEGEWQPGIDVGDEVALIVMIEEDDEYKNVCVGAFRITEFETEIIYDSDTEFTYRGSYQGEYLGRADYEDAEALELLPEAEE